MPRGSLGRCRAGLAWALPPSVIQKASMFEKSRSQTAPSGSAGCWHAICETISTSCGSQWSGLGLPGMTPQTSASQIVMIEPLSEEGVRLAQTMQVGPYIPVEILL